jgi:hypothetical protein
MEGGVHMKLIWFKRVGAVLAGLVTVVVLSVATDVVMEKLGVFPSVAQQQASGLWTPALLVLATAYRTLYTVAGGFLTCTLAPDRPMRHVWTLGILGVVMGTLGAAANWGKGPAWYPIALIVLALPSVWLGGKIKMETSRTQ